MEVSLIYVADGVVLMTEWSLFRNLDMDQIKSRLKSLVFIDLRNVYEPKKMADLGVHYISVGRPSYRPKNFS